MQPLLAGAVHILLAIQGTQGVVTGAVRDGETGAPLAGAVVALSDLDRWVTTNPDGRYALLHVPAGPHRIEVRFIGYAPRSLQALVPEDGQLEINVSLRPEPVRLQTVEVRAAPGAVPAAAGDSMTFPDRGTTIAAIWSHPLLAEPDALQALGGGEVVLQPESPDGIHIRGGASDQTAYLLDDVPVFSPYHAAGPFSAWNPDALAGLRLWSSAPPPGYATTLSGTVVALTREPAGRLRAQGGLSSTQARATVDGPLGAAGAGYLVSLRSTFPSAFAPAHEASYVMGETGDRLAKLEAPTLGGRLRLLGYDSENEIDAAARSEGDSTQDLRRNQFAWSGRSLGAEWRRAFASTTVRLLAWRATSHAASTWTTDTAFVRMRSERGDDGLVVDATRTAARATTVAGVRLERSRTAYRISGDSAGGGPPAWLITARTPVATAFAQHAAALGDRLTLSAATALAAAGRRFYLGPRAQLRWAPGERVTLSGSYARTHQFTQSLRNEESVVGNVFPVDLYVGAAAPGVPVARSDQGVFAADYRPRAGVRFGGQAYARRMEGLVLVAPRSGEPFATNGFAVGSGTSHGVSFDGAVSSARYGLTLTYGFQRVRLRTEQSGYVPTYGATHLFEGGVIVFPTATSSVRLGVTGALGRRTTTVTGFEWESCNLLDRGCELAGSPRNTGDPLGGTALPAYLRVDLGLRRHWRIAMGGRETVIALFGTVTNIFAARNVLTYTRDPATSRLVPIEMRPLAPLVIGLDWRF